MSAIAVLPGRIEVDMPRPSDVRGSGSDPVQPYIIVRVDGELDAIVLPEFRQTLALAVSAGAPVVVLDMHNTRFLSLGNAAVLICATTDATVAGVDLRLVAGRREVERVLQVTGARSLLNSYPSVRAALDK